MNGIHDLGGMHGFGRVEREENEPCFHEEWEGAVFAISQIVRNIHHLFNVDEFRRGIETMDPADYLAASYYERWLRSIEVNLIEKGIIAEAELDQRVEAIREGSSRDGGSSAIATAPKGDTIAEVTDESSGVVTSSRGDRASLTPYPLSHPKERGLKGDAILNTLPPRLKVPPEEGGRAGRQEASGDEGTRAGPERGRSPDEDPPPPRFAVGDPVVARNVHPKGHTRVPRYLRGKRGVVDRVRGAQVFPDTNAHGLGKHPQTVYSVRFTGGELWGESAEVGQTLFIDLWESYLEPG